MNLNLKEKFAVAWKRYFDNAELPISFYYTDEDRRAELVRPGSMPRCAISALSDVRRGRALCFNVDAVGCPGGKKYFGFVQGVMPDFEYFLSCGIPNKLTGERYKKSPDLVKEAMKFWPIFEAPNRLIVFKRWDLLTESDEPEVVIFFAEADVLAGLFTLANFDEAEQNGVFTPFGAGCSTIVQYPYLEKNANRPRGVIGMFDISARPFVSKNTLTFSAPFNKFARMIENMEESFLITESWARVQKRLSKAV